MSIADKLVTVVENERSISNGINTEADLISEIQSLVDNLPEAGGGYEEGYTDGYDAGVTDGRAKQFSEYVARCNYQSNFLWAFAGVGWGDTIYGGKYPPNYLATEDMVFKCHGNSASMYAYSSITDTVATISLDTSSLNASATFDNSRLVTIRKLIVSEKTPALQFASCSRLENITVEGVIANSWKCKACPLTNETVQNIIDHLKDLTGQTTQTLTLKADVGAAVTDAQKAAITSKNWTLVY